MAVRPRPKARLIVDREQRVLFIEYDGVTSQVLRWNDNFYFLDGHPHMGLIQMWEAMGGLETLKSDPDSNRPDAALWEHWAGMAFTTNATRLRAVLRELWDLGNSRKRVAREARHTR